MNHCIAINPETPMRHTDPRAACAAHHADPRQAGAAAATGRRPLRPRPRRRPLGSRRRPRQGGAGTLRVARDLRRQGRV